MAKLDDLKALQAQAAAAVSRSPSIANKRKLRKAQEALAAERERLKPKPKSKAPQPGPGYGVRATEAAALEPTPGVAQPGIDVRAIQQRLVDSGYGIKVDGAWGPLSKAAWDDFTAKGGSMTSDAKGGAAPAPAPIPDATGSGGGGGGAAPAAATAATPAPAAPKSASDIAAAYPQLAGFLNIPIVGDKIRQAVAEGWPPEKLAAEIGTTDWWKTTPQKARAWLGLYALDPASAERQIDERVADVKKAAGQYFVPMADVTAREWAKKVLSGEVPEDAFAGYLKEQAKSLFPALAGAIDSGVTVETYADPYRQVAARTLEINPNEVNFNDPKWQKALMQVDKDGNRVSMSLSDWTNTLRNDAAYGWDRTTQAREQAADFVGRLQKTFGKA